MVLSAHTRILQEKATETLKKFSQISVLCSVRCWEQLLNRHPTVAAYLCVLKQSLEGRRAGWESKLNPGPFPVSIPPRDNAISACTSWAISANPTYTGQFFFPTLSILV